jgi:hypothetical protein
MSVQYNIGCGIPAADSLHQTMFGGVRSWYDCLAEPIAVNGLLHRIEA